MPETEETVVTLPRCVFCKVETNEESFCSGCRSYVCEACDERGMDIPFGGHAVFAHQENSADYF